MKRTWLPLVPLFGLGVSWVLASGCATDAAPPEDEDSGVTPPTDAARDGTTTTDARPPGVDSSVRDSAVPDGAKTDASADARADATPTDSGIVANPGELVDPTAPKTGDVCPTGVPEFDSISRRCGKCGTQRALCEAGRVVGTYGPCTAEKTGDVCYPNAVEVGVECGLCGSQVRKCDLTCAWSTGVCLGEVANGCVKNETTYVEGVCPTIDETRKQVCSPTCVRSNPAPCAVQGPDVLVAPQTAAGTAEGTYSLTSLRKMPRLNSGACPAASSAVNSGYHWLRINNPGAESVNVTVTTDDPASGPKADLYVSGYIGTAVPADAAERQACVDAVRASPETVTLTIPAGGSGFFLSAGATAATTGRFRLVVKTNFIGPEPPPPIDHVVTIGPNANDVVTQAVQFVSTQVGTRPGSSGFGACPTVITTTATYGYRYIRVVNPTATAKTVDIIGDEPADTVLAVYPGPDAPISTQRTACLGSTNDTCATTALGDSCVLGVSIPANGSVVAYYGPWSSSSYPSATFRVVTK